MSTFKSWEVNGHMTWCNSPVPVVLWRQLASRWGLQQTEISTALWAHETREALYFYFTHIMAATHRLAWLLSFKQPLLSVDMSVCTTATKKV